MLGFLTQAAEYLRKAQKPVLQLSGQTEGGGLVCRSARRQEPALDAVPKELGFSAR